MVLQARIRRAATPDQSVPMAPVGRRWPWSAGRATTAAASDVRSGPVTEAGLPPDLNAPRWSTGAAWRWERTNERRPEVAGAASVLHKCSGYQACTMRRVARSRRQAHENRVLTQTTALSLIAACSAWVPGAARAGNTGREDGPSLLIRPWPVDVLYRQVYSAFLPTTRAPARAPWRWVIHNSRWDRQDLQ